MSKGKLLRNVMFPSIIDAIALDPGEHVFYAGGRDGKIYVAALNAESTYKNNYGLHIINSFSTHRFVLLCLVNGYFLTKCLNLWSFCISFYCEASSFCNVLGNASLLLEAYYILAHNFMLCYLHSKAVTCLAYGTTGNFLISGSEDGMVRVWDARTHNIVRVFKHAKGFSM